MRRNTLWAWLELYLVSRGLHIWVNDSESFVLKAPASRETLVTKR